jgi:glutamate-1-semialdehyde 2,1-aminomutase
MLEEGIYLAQRGFIALNIEMEESHLEKFLKATEGFVGTYGGALDH